VLLIFVLAFLMLLSSLWGYYMGPGFGYYIGGGVSIALLLGIIYRVFAGGRKGKGLTVRSEVEGPSDPN
jgi:hypothetical protein